MIVLDASLLIAHLDGEDAMHDRAGAVLRQYPDGPLQVSPITLAEVLVGPARMGMTDAALAAIEDLRVETANLPTDAPVRLAELRASTKLKLPDCCVLLAALSVADLDFPAEQTADRPRASIATFDDQLITAARSHGIDVA